MWEDDPVQMQSQCRPIPGRDAESSGVTPFRELTSSDQRIFDKYKDVINEKIRQEQDVNLPEDFKLAPSEVAKQTEVPENCYFRIDLPHSTVYIKIVPNPHITDLSKHVTIHQPHLSTREASIIELDL